MQNEKISSWRPSARFNVLILRLFGCAALAFGAWILWPAPRPAPAALNTLAATPAATPSGTAAIPSGTTATPPAVQEASIASIIEVVVARNDTLEAIFRRMQLNLADLAAIRSLPGARQSLDYLKPGDAIKVTHTDGDIKGLSRKVSDTQTLEVVREEAGFSARMVDNPVEVRVRTATATIDSSLFAAAEAADISDPVALKLANVFAWDIDFVLDIREGDHFTAVYQQIYQDGKFLRDGEVLAAEFVNNGKVYRAVRFVSDSGSVGYYTPAGSAMRKAFLRAPLEFTRVSSAFNPHRLHPILNTIRGHMGTDYAAPTGTPVHAAGDGRVSFAGWRGGYGNAIVLAHGSSVSTLYGHMSRFAKTMHVGARVDQGEVIGYVGMTGLATGPHLHYEYLMNGVHKNPQTVQLPGAEPLRAAALQRFLAAAAPLLADLSPPVGATSTPPVIAASPNAGSAPAGSVPAGSVPAGSASAGSDWIAGAATAATPGMDAAAPSGTAAPGRRAGAPVAPVAAVAPVASRAAAANSHSKLVN